MHNITQKAVAAFNNSKDFFLSNTCVSNYNDTTTFCLFGNRIAWKDNNDNDTIWFCLCGWDTTTTCERLRGLGLPIHHIKKQLFCGATPINEDTKYSFNKKENCVVLYDNK